MTLLFNVSPPHPLPRKRGKEKLFFVLLTHSAHGMFGSFEKWFSSNGQFSIKF
jgi:hypothetical protein